MQDGCFFEVDDVEKAYTELQANGLQQEPWVIDTEKYGDTEWRVFYVVAPDGLCYCYGERQLPQASSRVTLKKVRFGSYPAWQSTFLSTRKDTKRGGQCIRLDKTSTIMKTS